MPSNESSGLGRSLLLISFSGCLAQVFLTCTTSPVTTEFFRLLGAKEWHFGLLGGLPMMMLSLQFAGAFIGNRLGTRKAVFMWLIIPGRLLFLLVAFMPMMLGPRFKEFLIPAIIFMMALHYAVVNVTVPLWFSWMGDLIPSRILNRYWGIRHQYMTVTWTLSFLLISFLTYRFSSVSAVTAFQFLVTAGVAAGVIDILLFIWVDEPPATQVVDRSALDILSQPLRDNHYRRFIWTRMGWMFAAMFAAAFMQLYVLEVLKIPLWQVNFIWCSAGLGGALSAGEWGKMADRHGTRPIIIVTTALKPMIVLIFLFITPRTAAFVLPFAFFLDSIINAGMMVACNGYMLKAAPAENRSMFVAVITALSGLAAGVGAMLGGALLNQLSEFSWTAAGRTWGNYHVLFAVSLLLRIGCFIQSYTIREPESAGPMIVLSYFRGSWPLRMFTFPVGLYQRLIPGRPDDDEPAS